MKVSQKKEVSRPKENGIVIKERSSTPEELKVQPHQAQGKGKEKLYEVNDLLMGEGEGVEEDKVGIIMIASIESKSYSQYGYLYQILKKMKQSLEGNPRKYVELLKSNILSTRVFMSNTRKWVVSVNLPEGASFYILMNFIKSLEVTILIALLRKLNSSNSIFN